MFCVRFVPAGLRADVDQLGEFCLGVGRDCESGGAVIDAMSVRVSVPLS